MCGLIGVFAKKNGNVTGRVVELYQKQKKRGSSGFGFLAINGDEIIASGRAKDENSIRSQLKRTPASGILFHHRFPTSTENTLGTTHPIFVSNKELEFDYYVSHNGVIRNHHLLKSKHEILGYQYRTLHKNKTVVEYQDGSVEEVSSGVESYNDSECFAIEIARQIDGVTEKSDIIGAAAFWAVKLVKGTNKIIDVMYGTNSGRSLKEFNYRKHYGFSSETGVDVANMYIYHLNLKNGKKTLTTWHTNKYSNLVVPVQAPSQRSIGFHSSYQERGGSEYSIITENKYKSAKYNVIINNKEYLETEARDSGLPMGEFFKIDKNGVSVYVPICFAGKGEDRVLYNGGVMALPTPKSVGSKIPISMSLDSYDEKVIDRLETLCLEYCELESKVGSLEARYHNRKLSTASYEMLDSQYTAAIYEIENNISLLNLPDEVVYDTMESCRQLMDYQESYT